MAAAYERKDAAYRAAAQAGYRSRAAVKMRELDAKFRLLAPGMRVLDLGCWPGGWLQVIANGVGTSGTVVGVDTQAVDDLGLKNVRTVVADLRSAAALDDVAAVLSGSVDLVVSDLAPKLSGIRDVDRTRQIALCESVVACCDRFLAPHGRCLLKLFSDSEAEGTRMLRSRFAKVSTYRPESTRKGSAEIYALGTDYTRPTRGD